MEETKIDPNSSRLLTRVSQVLSRFFVWASLLAWRNRVDWRTRRPLFTRATAHITIIFLAVGAFLLGGIKPIDQVLEAAALQQPVTPFFEGATPVPQPTALSQPARAWQQAPPPVVSRLALPHTTFPDRPRSSVITYTIQEGDNVGTIADRFGLNIYSVIWSNREALQDAVWLIQPGIELYIPPVDGVYHTVLEGDTISSIAEKYEVDPSALYNEWNDLEQGDAVQEGQLVMVPGGTDEYVDLEPPPPPPAYATAGAAYMSSGICSGVTFTGPGGNGWFIYPTGSSAVSGWYFHDPRNPRHIGLDYRCHLGDPIYAADNGVVTIAGWNGGYGILVEVNHGNGFTTRYGHFSDLIVGCGQAVTQGQLLGYCGSTGWSTGPHLHFETRYGGIPQDPMYYLP